MLTGWLSHFNRIKHATLAYVTCPMVTLYLATIIKPSLDETLSRQISPNSVTLKIQGLILRECSQSASAISWPGSQFPLSEHPGGPDNLYMEAKISNCSRSSRWSQTSFTDSVTPPPWFQLPGHADIAKKVLLRTRLTAWTSQNESPPGTKNTNLEELLPAFSWGWQQSTGTAEALSFPLGKS